MTTDLLNLLKQQLADIDAGWSIGSFGAIGEFHQRPTDQLLVDDLDSLTRATDKGAIRLDPRALQQGKTVAFETLSPRPHRWSQGVVFCLPAEQAIMNQRAVLTELGPDNNSIRPQDQQALLFDMGLDQIQIDFCIRTRDPELIGVLRQHQGLPLAQPGNPSMAMILAKHPHRVVLSKLGRVEVYQKIGGPDTGGVSPDGPHTHVLPKLLKAGRTHSANIPVPKGYTPCANLHPASPVMGPNGEDIPFDSQRYATFQQILQRYGCGDYLQVRDQVMTPFSKLTDAETYSPPNNRLGRTAVKNTLRQIRRIGGWDDNSEINQWLENWQIRFDQRVEWDDADDELLGHP